MNIAALQQENAQLNATVASLTSELDSFKQQLDSFKQQLDSLKQQLDWFQRQLFGRKSEKRLAFDAREQGNLLFGLGVEAPPEQDPVPTEKITYQRRKKQRAASVNDSGLRFDASVPVTTIHVTDPQIAAIPEADRQVIAEKVSYRLAQEPGSYRVLKYIRQVVKRRDTGELVTAAAVPNVLAYIEQARPQVDEEKLFLRVVAPHRPLSRSSVISGIVCRALNRAGIHNIPSRGAHLFRHSLATALVRGGASLEEIGTLLRHRSPDTTAIYAKTDLTMLQEISQPWLGGVR